VFTDLPLGATWEASDQQRGRRGLLISYTGGAFGRQAAGRSARRRIRVAANGLTRVFPGSAPLIGGAKSIAWAAERFSGGCWVCYGPGQTVRHWPALVGGPSDGRIHLAGEHTERSSGYMNSAISSGIDAARRVRAY
jgi:monoamine oxidase